MRYFINPLSSLINPIVLHVFLKTNDYCAIPLQLKEQVSERYPEARLASLKTGGDFPFLSRPDEVNLHLQVSIFIFGIYYARKFMF